MKVAFRVDASLQIGIGHVMRCLTLADALAAKGASCLFLCKAHEGNLIDYIQRKGHIARSLQSASDTSTVIHLLSPTFDSTSTLLAHSHWLGSSQAQDAEACACVLAEYCPDWLIVDHYGLDATWEEALAPYSRHLMVIDDLADRFHQCDLLLDQTFGRQEADYRPLVPQHCRLLCGSKYALLRPEFAALRPYSLKRRTSPALHRLLISMGGVDKDNATSKVLQALRACPLPSDCRIAVVMGATAPWLEDVRNQAENMPWETQVLVDVRNMAQLMSDSDLAIGAAGATSWERCCLGLPTIMMLLAPNQCKIARNLEQAGAARVIDPQKNLTDQLIPILGDIVDRSLRLLPLIESASRITDGSGASIVSQLTEGYHGHF